MIGFGPPGASPSPTPTSIASSSALPQQRLKLEEEDASKDETRSSFFESPMRRRNGGSPVALTRVMPTITIKKPKLHLKSPKHCAAKQNQHRGDFNPSILWKLLSTLFTALLAVILLVWLVLRPSKPSFSLKQASVCRLSLSDSSLAASLLNSSIQLTLRVSNPNAHLGIYYDELRIYASYEGQQITNQISFPPFYQGQEDNNLLSASLDGNNLPVAPYFESEVAHNQVTGKLKMEFAADGRIRWKVGTWISGRYRLNVECVAVMDFGPGLPTGPLTSPQGSQCSAVL